MGLNFVIGCHECKKKVYLYRDFETIPMHKFYRAHWDCFDQDKSNLAFGDDQTFSGENFMDYEDEFEYIEDSWDRYGFIPKKKEKE